MNKQNLNKDLKEFPEIEEVISKLSSLREDMLSMATESEDLLQNCCPSYLSSAQNLLYYLALRSHDIEALQVSLGDIGLSSLGRTELNVLASVDTVLTLLHQWGKQGLELSQVEFKALETKDG